MQKKINSELRAIWDIHLGKAWFGQPWKLASTLVEWKGKGLACAKAPGREWLGKSRVWRVVAEVVWNQTSVEDPWCLSEVWFHSADNSALGGIRIDQTRVRLSWEWTSHKQVCTRCFPSLPHSGLVLGEARLSKGFWNGSDWLAPPRNCSWPSSVNTQLPVHFPNYPISEIKSITVSSNLNKHTSVYIYDALKP